MRRRRPDQTPRATVEGVRLYLDDVAFFYEELARHGEVSIESGEWSVDSVAELAELPHTRTRELSLRIEGQSGAAVEVAKSGVFIRVHADENEAHRARGLVDALEKRAQSRRTLTARLVNFRAVVLLLAPAVLLFFVALILQNGLYTLAAAFVLGIAIAMNGVWLYIAMSRNALVVLRFKRDAPSWWTRNRDQILVGIVVGVVVAAVTIPVTWMLSRK